MVKQDREKRFFGRQNRIGIHQRIGVTEKGSGDDTLLVDYDFQNTMKLKLDDESDLEEIILIIYFDTRRCPFGEDISHISLHEQHVNWRANLLEKIARK